MLRIEDENDEQSVLNAMKRLNLERVEEITEANYLVIHPYRPTTTTFLALINAIPIVTPAFVHQLELETDPDFQKFLPRSKLLQRWDKKDLLPDQRRKTVFKGMAFYFVRQADKDQHGPLVLQGGGTIAELNKTGCIIIGPDNIPRTKLLTAVMEVDPIKLNVEEASAGPSGPSTDEMIDNSTGVPDYMKILDNLTARLPNFTKEKIPLTDQAHFPECLQRNFRPK